MKQVALETAIRDMQEAGLNVNILTISHEK